MLADEQTVKRNKTRARLILGLEHRRNTNPLELLLWGASTKKNLEFWKCAEPAGFCSVGVLYQSNAA
jgi:hypothetical protein